MEMLPESLLHGEFLHCQPVEDGPVVEARITPSDINLTPTFKMLIACSARRPCSECIVRINAGSEDKHCLYYKGDSRGVYQIVGPDAYIKSDRGYR